MAALGLLVIVLARGGGEPSAQRQALEHDPMASYVAPGGRSSTPTPGTRARPSASRSKPRTRGSFSCARAPRRSTAPAPRRPRPGTVGETTERGFLAERRVASGRLELAVTLIEDAQLLPDDLEPPALSVSLRHLGAA